MLKPYEPNDPTTWQESADRAEQERTAIEGGVSPAHAADTDVAAEPMPQAVQPQEPRPAPGVYETNVIQTQEAPFQAGQSDQIVLPLVEEGLRVEKKWVQAGEVVLHKEVQTRTESVPVDLAYEEVDVRRVPVNRVLAEGETARPRQDGDTLIVPVIEEELVVLKRLVLREEVHVTKRRVTHREEVTEQVRSEQVRVETIGQIAQEPEAGSS